MATAELSTWDSTQRRAKSPRSYQSGQMFDVPMASRRVRVIPRGRDEPQSGYLTHDIMLFTILTSLPDRSIRVVHPLRIVVRPKSGVYMASLVDAAISASGESLADAVESLKDVVAAKFRLFSRKESILGKHLRCQLHVLRQSLRAT